MQAQQGGIQGVKKQVTAQKDTKEYDIDRKRDDSTLLDIDSLMNAEEQVDKKEITMFQSGTVNLLWKIDSDKSSYKWVDDGEV